jgi:hypothetical protein
MPSARALAPSAAAPFEFLPVAGSSPTTTVVVVAGAAVVALAGRVVVVVVVVVVEVVATTAGPTLTEPLRLPTTIGSLVLSQHVPLAGTVWTPAVASMTMGPEKAPVVRSTSILAVTFCPPPPTSVRSNTTSTYQVFVGQVPVTVVVPPAGTGEAVEPPGLNVRVDMVPADAETVPRATAAVTVARPTMRRARNAIVVSYHMATRRSSIGVSAMVSATFGAVLLVVAAGCSSSATEPSSVGPSSAADGTEGSAIPITVSNSVVDYAALRDDVAPLAEPLGWDVQRAYRQPANILRRDVELVNVYLRPLGDEPSPETYLADAMLALQTIASDVFARDATVTAIDVCLQRANDAPSDVEVEPAIRILGFREDLAPLVANELRLADLVDLSGQGRLVLMLDDYVKQAPEWAAAMAVDATTVP